VLVAAEVIGPAAATAATDEDDEGTSRLSPTAEADCGITFSGDLPLFRERENIFLYMYLLNSEGNYPIHHHEYVFLLGGSTLALNPPQILHLTIQQPTRTNTLTQSHTQTLRCRLLCV
jgi:hypothetical protein